MDARARTYVGLVSLALATASAQAAEAEFSAKDAQVLGRTLGYVGDGNTGTAVVGVVFTSADPASQQGAERVRAVVGDGLSTGRVRLQVHLIPVSQLAGVTGLDALYVTSGLAGSMGAVTTAAQRLHVPTVSTDPTCLQSGACVVGFSSEPTVQIVIDRAAAERAGVRFVQAFRMLVKEK